MQLVWCNFGWCTKNKNNVVLLLAHVEPVEYIFSPQMNRGHRFFVTNFSFFWCSGSPDHPYVTYLSWNVSRSRLWLFLGVEMSRDYCLHCAWYSWWRHLISKGKTKFVTITVKLSKVNKNDCTVLSFRLDRDRTSLQEEDSRIRMQNLNIIEIRDLHQSEMYEIYCTIICLEGSLIYYPF